MSDLIDRQEAIDAANRTDYRGLTVEEVTLVTDEVVKELQKLPSVKNEANVIIEEHKNKSLIELGVVFGIDRFFCSECKNEIDIGYDYCPKCGSKLIWRTKKD